VVSARLDRIADGWDEEDKQMSVEWVKGEVVFTCDACDDTLETGEDDFSTARAVYRREGWANRKLAEDEWENRCPTCKGDRGHD
jgi:Zn finger protein HypA/HybF involved in hydrogenase expression